MASSLPPHTSPLTVLHVASGDRWAGAEAQLHTLLTHLNKRDDIQARAVLLNEDETAERLRASGVSVDVLDESRLNGLRIFLDLRRLLRRYQPHVIHTHRQKENVLAGLANATTLRAPCARTVHGAPEHAPPWIQLHKHLFRWLDLAVGCYLQDRVIAVSRDLQDRLSAIFPRGKVTLVNNGVDIESIVAMATHPAEFRLTHPQHRHIGLVGRLEPVKRGDIFLMMAALLCRENLPWPLRFHIFGDGSLRASLEAQAKMLNLGDSVRFHGYRKDISVCMASLDVFLVCSDHEGLPMTVLESVVLGTPVVAHRVGGLAEVLDDSSGGMLVRQHDPRDYAQAVLEVLFSPSKANECVRNGQNRIERYYSADVNAENMVKIYFDFLLGYKPRDLLRNR